MAGVAGNYAEFAFGKQTAKGTAATNPEFRTPFTGGNAAPAREIDQLSETDNSRQEGSSFVRSTGSAGAPSFYARDSIAHRVLQLTLGTKVTTGATNYTHTLTPAATLPYFTSWRTLGGILWEEFDDCVVSELNFTGGAGDPLQFTLSYNGRSATKLASDPTAAWTALPILLQSNTPENFSDSGLGGSGFINLGGSVVHSISSYDLTISNNTVVQQTDNRIPYDIAPGQLQVTLGFDMIFETAAEYNTWNYGAGTTQTNAINDTSLNALFWIGANNSIEIDLPHITYEEFPADPDPGGAPVTVAARARTLRTTTPITAVVKNQVAV